MTWVKKEMPKQCPLSTRTPNSRIFEEIPTNYDDALTYMEFLTALLRKVNCLINTVNLIIENVDGFGKDIEDLNTAVDEIKEQVLDISLTIAEIRGDISRIDDEIDTLHAKDADLQQQINDLPNLIYAVVDQKDAALKAEIQGIIDNNVVALQLQIANLTATFRSEFDDVWATIERLGNANYITVYDPNLAENITLQEFINNVYEGDRPYALTAGEYDTLELTASDYDGYQLSAYDYDFNGKRLLVVI